MEILTVFFNRVSLFSTSQVTWTCIPDCLKFVQGIIRQLKEQGITEMDPSSNKSMNQSLKHKLMNIRFNTEFFSNGRRRTLEHWICGI